MEQTIATGSPGTQSSSGFTLIELLDYIQESFF